MNETRAVIFDLDGTLFGTKRLYLEAYRRALHMVTGRLYSDAELVAADPRSEIRFFDALAGAEAARCRAVFADEYRGLHASHFDGVYPGTPELLAELRRRRLLLGLVTGKSRSSWMVTAIHAELGHFDAQVLDDDVSAPKPDPEGLLLAAARLDIVAGRCVYVGDSRGDMEAAAAAGMRGFLALWSRPKERRQEMREFAGAVGARTLDAPHELLYQL